MPTLPPSMEVLPTEHGLEPSLMSQGVPSFQFPFHQFLCSSRLLFLDQKRERGELPGLLPPTRARGGGWGWWVPQGCVVRALCPPAASVLAAVVEVSMSH